MFLTKLDNETREVLDYLGVNVDSPTLYCDEYGAWRDKSMNFLGISGWDGIFIDKGPDFEYPDHCHELVEINNNIYYITEGD